MDLSTELATAFGLLQQGHMPSRRNALKATAPDTPSPPRRFLAPCQVAVRGPGSQSWEPHERPVGMLRVAGLQKNKQKRVEIK